MRSNRGRSSLLCCIPLPDAPAEDGLPLLTCIVSCQGVPPEFHDRYKEAVEKQPAPAENGAPQEVSIVLGHGPAAKSVK